LPVDIASIVLLFVAGGLLLVAVSHWTAFGRAEPAATRYGLAVMSGLALGFLSLSVAVFPLIVFPVVMAVVLIRHWLAEGRLTELGAFLVAGASFWVLELGYARLTDLGDPAVVTPGWTPIPLAVATALVVLGATLILGARLARTP
jgi:hypothetical protein